jgi:hypothetical protein
MTEPGNAPAKARRRRLKTALSGILAAAAVYVVVWELPQPSNDRPWQPDVSRTAWAAINGDRLTIHNLRNCVYRTETDYEPRWEERTLDLWRLRALDIFITYWGSPYIAHPILSFVFDDGSHVAFSIETRKEIGEEYSSIKGFFRQYELTYIAADERYVVRLRSNYRKGEDVYLYRTTTPPQRARAMLLDYVARMNSLHEKPEWYNALTSNCTTNIRIHSVHASAGKAPPWDWRILANGLGDRMLHERGNLAGDLPFEQLKAQALINPAARAAGGSEEFSRLIRAGKEGF